MNKLLTSDFLITIQSAFYQIPVNTNNVFHKDSHNSYYFIVWKRCRYKMNLKYFYNIEGHFQSLGWVDTRSFMCVSIFLIL